MKGLCCWGTDYCKCSCLGLSRNQNIKITYHFLIILTYSTVLLFQAIISQFSDSMISKQGCEEFVEKQGCVWSQMKFRALFSISLMHLILFIIMFFRNQTSKVMNEGAWLPKLLFIVLLSVLLIFVIPASIMSYIHSLSVFISIFWWFIQNLIILDLIFALDVRLKQIAQDSPKIHILKAVFAVLILAGAIVLNVFGYNRQGLESYNFMNIVNSIMMVVFIVIVLIRVVPSNTLFSCVLILLYINALSYFSPQNHFASQTFFLAGRKLLVLIVLLGFLTPGSNKIRTKKATINELLALNTSRQQQDNRYVSSNKWIVYHYILFILCICIPIFLEGEAKSTGVWADDLSDVYSVCGWVIAYFIYMWSIISGKLYPEDDFSEFQNYFKQYELN